MRELYRLVTPAAIMALVMALASADARAEDKICYVGERAQVGSDLKWFGTAPFCNGKSSDCSDAGGVVVTYSKKGDGDSCVSGQKVQCRIPRYETVQICIPKEAGYTYEWKGTAPSCDAGPIDCTNDHMEYLVSNKTGDGKTCSSGTKVLCRKPNKRDTRTFPNWMWDNRATLGDRVLKDIVLPGTHDSGCYEFPDLEAAVVPWVKTQDETIYNQLMGGVRFFDIRPTYVAGKFRIHHDLFVGPPLDTVLADIARFAKGRHELIILSIDGIDKTMDPPSVKAAYGALLKKHLGPYVFMDPETRPTQLTLNQIVKDGSKVIIYSPADTPGLASYRENKKRPAYISGSFANVDDYDKMYVDQRTKLDADGGDASRLFHLSWTITQQFLDPSAIDLRNTASSVEQLSWRANPKLFAFGQLLCSVRDSARPNIVSVDFYRDARLMDTVFELNNLYGNCPSGREAKLDSILGGKTVNIRSGWRCPADARCGQHVSYAGSMVKLYPKANTTDLVPWQLTPVTGHTDQFYIRTRWHCPGDARCDQHLSFTGQEAKLYAKNDTTGLVPWRFIPVTGKPGHYYIRNQWRCDRKESRCDQHLSFSGTTVKLYDKNNTADLVPWEITILP